MITIRLPKSQWAKAWRAMIEVAPVRLVASDPVYEILPAHLELLSVRGFTYEVVRPRPSPPCTAASVALLAALILFLVPGLLYAQDKEYSVRFFVPDKVGSKRSVDTKRTQKVDHVVKKDGKVVEESGILNEVEFVGTIEVLGVDNRGQENNILITIEKLTWTANKDKPQEGAKPGTVVVGQMKEGKPVFSAKEGETQLSEIAELLLPRVTKLGSDPTSDEQVFKTEKPQKVGAPWPANKNALLEAYRRADPSIKPEGISGSGQVVAVKDINDKDHLEVRLELSIQSVGPVPAAGVPVELSIKAINRMVTPADYSTGPIEETVVATTKRVIKGKPGTEKEDIVVETNSSNSSTIKTVYLKK